MRQIREEAVQRMQRDHDAMIALIRRIRAACGQLGMVDDCGQCPGERRAMCHGDVEQLIRAFVEATLKHHMMESLYMAEGVPVAHRQAHTQAHQRMAEQLKSIRVVLSADGNCVQAIEGIDAVLTTLLAHLAEYDRQLEDYLLATA